MADPYPSTHAEVKARLTTVNTLLITFEASAEQFATLTVGSVKVDPMRYVLFLERQRDRLLKQLDELPYWRGSTPEQVG